ncbi:hypothetical protein OS493_019540 [Desmophyllum pertusum]|uniref:Uncharacterized protein n=1 Tax=Desmophyllum pertusum TaxID=174260 RepID=A0A9W9ZND5_9CNID|nr:hypothetical protein OS493_019540 [Desmophyllum pertusum]
MIRIASEHGLLVDPNSGHRPPAATQVSLWSKHSGQDRANAQTPSLDSLTTAQQTTSTFTGVLSSGVTREFKSHDNKSTQMVSDHKSPNGAANYGAFALCYFSSRGSSSLSFNGCRQSSSSTA